MSDRAIPDNDALGLSPAQRDAAARLARPGSLVGRVVSEAKGAYRVWASGNEFVAECTGRMLAHAEGRGDLPAVGDWVLLVPAMDLARASIVAVLPRRTAFVRRAAGPHAVAQVVAANIDTVFVAMGLDMDFNLRRVERYLTVAWESGATPVVVLTRCDLVEDPTVYATAVRAVAGRAEVIVTSAQEGIGIDDLRARLVPRKTVAILGSSGVGKSTLANLLLRRNELRVGDVRARDRRGRHTTTHRQLLVLPEGALLIDTPGMRELRLWDVQHGLDEAFEDITDVAARCHFRDCQHGTEPGCAVQRALLEGSLDRDRYAHWLKLRDELGLTRDARRLRHTHSERRLR